MPQASVLLKIAFMVLLSHFRKRALAKEFVRSISLAARIALSAFTAGGPVNGARSCAPYRRSGQVVRLVEEVHRIFSSVFCSRLAGPGCCSGATWVAKDAGDTCCADSNPAFGASARTGPVVVAADGVA